MKRNFALLLASLLFSIVLGEVLARIFLPDNPDVSHAEYLTSSYPTLPDPNKSVAITLKTPDGDLLYDVQYNFDSFGRRLTPNIPKASVANLYFGGSYVFGEGLDDNETLPWLLSEKFNSLQSYNYAQRGYGPNNMLAMILEQNFNEQIPNDISEVNAYFFSYKFHAERYLGSIRWVGQIRTNDPYFKMTDGKLRFLGNFANDRPIRTFIYWSLYHSKLVRLTFRSFENFSSEKSVKLMCALVNTSAEKLKNKIGIRFNNFYFVESPFQGERWRGDYYLKVKACLDSSIQYIKVFSPANFKTKYLIDKKLEPHPNSFANEWLAEWLIQNQN